MADKPIKKVGISTVAKVEIDKIFSADTAGFSKKLAIAMAGTESKFVMGIGSGGKFSKAGGYGRIHGLGAIDTRSGLGMHGNLGGKVNRFGSATKAKETCMEQCLNACK